MTSMAQPLPPLRMDLDFMPSPIDDRPGLLIRDTFHFSDATLIIPPVLVQVLRCFDGEYTELDLKQQLFQITGELDTEPIARHLIETLSTAGFLDDETYAQLKEARLQVFAEASIREPSHAGAGYPIDPVDLRQTFDGYLTGGGPALDGNLIGIAAPHVSPFGGIETYRAAYSALAPSHSNRTFIVLGTSHYGEPDRFGLTRKPFLSPYGETQIDLDIVNSLARQPAAAMEDYCHAVEHSIEFQVVFLQHVFGPSIRIVPILCGSFANSIYRGGNPEDNDGVNRFLGALGELAQKRNDLLWVLGIDMAHMGVRYQDRLSAIANTGEMLEVAARDKERIERINASDARGFWDLVQQNQDDLKWCGSSPLYTFLKSVPGAQGTLRNYQQWNIDEQSVVSFGALAFTSR
jgi:MEMO1 family protein